MRHVRAGRCAPRGAWPPVHPSGSLRRAPHSGFAPCIPVTQRKRAGAAPIYDSRHGQTPSARRTPEASAPGHGVARADRVRVPAVGRAAAGHRAEGRRPPGAAAARLHGQRDRRCSRSSSFLRNRGYAVRDLGPGAQRRLPAPSTRRRSSRRSATCTTRPGARSAWSAGAWAACSRCTARTRRRECVRSVITLGSPICGRLRRAARRRRWSRRMYRLIAHPMGPAAHSMQPRAKKLRERAAPAECR